MSNHEYYEELGALAAIGQITSDEGQELDLHLMECEGCREAQDDFGRILRRELPQATPRRLKLPESGSTPGEDQEIRDRFFARARASGIGLSPQAQQKILPSSRTLPAFFQWRYAAALAVVLLLVGMGWLASRQRVRMTSPAMVSNFQVNDLKELKGKEVSLRTQLAAAYQLIEQKSTELERLKQDNTASAESLQAFQRELVQAKRNADQLLAELQQAHGQSSNLSNENQKAQTLIADLRAQVESERRFRADDERNLGGQQIRIAELEESLRAASDKVERERQLSGVGRDIRVLMGARNLHIIDVQDIGGDGRSAKSFGRVFYAEGKSLVFYAFDLPNHKFGPAKYTFKGWGQQEATPQSPRHLGSFELDDGQQRRWVLKVDDPKLLSGIDSVFVTAELQGDNLKPRGGKILYAYLAGWANHP
jgi:hypothetical protein